MSPEKKRLENDFGCTNVICQPYLNDSSKQETCPVGNEKESCNPTIVLGNSNYSFDVYPEVLEKLPFEKLGRVICMLNYGNETRIEEINRFVECSSEKYGAKFYPWRKKVDYETYCKTIAPASVYIAPLRTQTGLGISYLMLKWGRKVYVRGANLEWLRECGFIVFDLDTCDLTDAESLLKPLSAKEKKHNGAIWNQMFDLRINAENWDYIYSMKN